MSTFVSLPGGMSPLVRLMAAAALKGAQPLLRDFQELAFLQSMPAKRAVFSQKACARLQETIGYDLLRTDKTFELVHAFKTIEGMAWLVPDLDGILNFQRNVPHFSISLAALDHGAIVEALVFDPFRHEFFWAEREKGAFTNPQKRMYGSNQTDLQGALFGTGQWSKEPDFQQALGQLGKRGALVRQGGAVGLDLAYVAAGRFDGFLGGQGTSACARIGTFLAEESGCTRFPSERFLAINNRALSAWL